MFDDCGWRSQYGPCGRDREFQTGMTRRRIIELLDLQAGRADLFESMRIVLELVTGEDELRTGERKPCHQCKAP